ncbi:hypothetical protein ElyMa_003138200 [Elysia marginata]|uniref:Uncharacterized protein n=1 Tax=Elysia marginata TaxID=1093978 RepID=A0AAV4ITH5_9GAST|nr:hypothetical protein ElyMa_003138200 [Elysia marginata]
MQAYFNTLTTKFRGRPSTTLSIILNKELSQAFPQMKLKTTKDLQNLQSLAQDRGNWKSLLRRIEATESHSRGASLNLLGRQVPTNSTREADKSNVPSTTETFRKELKTSSIHGGTPQSPSTQRISASGSSIAIDGAEIPFVKM